MSDVIVPPLVSVVMPLFNAEAYVKQAVESILRQTLQCWELVVVDDGSTDRSRQLVADFDDPRIRLHAHTSNAGISEALNTGIGVAGAPIIARMDADDVSAPTRLEQQLAYLEGHPAVAAVGCSLALIDQSGERLGSYPLLTRNEDLRRLLTLQGPFAHGSVMFRRRAFDDVGPYLSAQQPAEDYGLWLRIARAYPIANLPLELYSLRITDTSVSATNREPQLARREQMRCIALLEMGPPRLGWKELRAGRRHYRAAQSPGGPALAAKFVSQHQELACLDAVRRGFWGTKGNLAKTVALGPAHPRTLKRMVRAYREEKRVATLLEALRG